MFAIRPFDPQAAPTAEWSALHHFRRTREAEDNPGEPQSSDADFEHNCRHPWPLFENRRHLAWHEDVVIGVLGYSFRRAGTPDHAEYATHAYAWGGVVRPWRRRGVATALVRPLLDFLVQHGRTTLTCDVHVPEGHTFLTALGAKENHRMVQNRLALATLDWSALALWEAAATLPGSALRWEIHAGKMALDRLEALLPQMNALFADVPLGTLNAPRPRFEMSGYRSWYDEIDRRGGEHFLVLLLAGEELAAMCEAAWLACFPDRAHQQLTAVARPWRGRDLAKAVKAAVLRLLRERHPDVALMTTANAEGNAPILAINRALGFAEYRHHATYQIGRDTLAAWLTGRRGGMPA